MTIYQSLSSFIDISFKSKLPNKEENDKSFEEIYSYIIEQGIKCNNNVNKCKIFVRNHRERDKDKLPNIIKDESVLFYIDLMDNIHSSLLHSYDIGYRVKVRKLKKK